MNAVEDDLSSDMQFVAFKRLYYGLELQREHRHFLGAPAEKSCEVMKTYRRYSAKYCMATGELQHPYPAASLACGDFNMFYVIPRSCISHFVYAS